MTKRFLSGILAAGVMTAMVLVNPAWAAETVRVTLLQLNDVYRIAPVQDGERGGMARIATLVKRMEAQNPHTFLVLAGDTISPSSASKLFQGRQMIDLWNRVGLDIATLGNHEFDFGPEVLKARMAESQFPWVIANVTDQTTGQPFGSGVPYVIKDVEGVKVGFFGLLTRDTRRASRPGPDVVFEDPLEAATSTVARMKAEGVDVIVAVTHLSMRQDKKLARELGYPTVAAILGGHEHTLLTSMAGGVPIFKVASDAVNLGVLDLYINAKTKALESMDWALIPVDEDVPEDPAIEEVVERYEDQLDNELGEALAHSTVELDGRQRNVRSRETNLGNLVADFYRQYWQADVALLNGGSIRSNQTYGSGPLTRQHVLAILPFGDRVLKVAVTGQQLRDALENGVSRLGDEEAGRFPQVSGLQFVYDGRRPAGSRVTRVWVGKQPLNAQKTYTLATPAYLLGGGDDYVMLRDARLLVEPEDAPLEQELVIEALEEAETVSPRVEGRIVRLDSAQ